MKELLNLNQNLKQFNLDLLKICCELCKLDDNFPSNDLWNEYYKTDLQHIIIISSRKKSSNII